MDFTQNANGEFFGRSLTESEHEENLRSIFKSNFPVDTAQWNHHLQVYLKRHNIMRVLHYNELYQKILDVPGDILDFGVHFGASSAVMLNLRGIYEPYNLSRKVWVFDTFEGLSGVSKDDPKAVEGGYAVPRSYEEILETILTAHEGFSPISHIKKFEIVKGDARITFDAWLKENPGTLIGLLHLDMDLYEPTAEVLVKALPRLTKGSLVVFDELTAKFFPGEAKALIDTVGAHNIRLKRTPFQPYSAYYQVE